MQVGVFGFVDWIWCVSLLSFKFTSKYLYVTSFVIYETSTLLIFFFFKCVARHSRVAPLAPAALFHLAAALFGRSRGRGRRNGRRQPGRRLAVRVDALEQRVREPHRSLGRGLGRALRDELARIGNQRVRAAAAWGMPGGTGAVRLG
jgi:hypothetical protein